MINGIVNVYKIEGFTSFDVVAKLRGIFKQKKIGHTGTLDPDATGVLPVCLGNATRVCELLTDRDKTYEAVMMLGITTDTQDTSGKITDSREVSSTEDEIKEAVFSFLGEYDQIPPMYSAKKINGRKLYELARDGVTVERKPCRVKIEQISLLETASGVVFDNIGSLKGNAENQSNNIWNQNSNIESQNCNIESQSYNTEGQCCNIESQGCNTEGLCCNEGNIENHIIGNITEEMMNKPCVRMSVTCSKGTYIRTLCNDIGEKLGCGAVMASLKRTKVGPFIIENAITLEELENRVKASDFGMVMPVDSVFMSYPALTVKNEAMKGLLNGNKLDRGCFEETVEAVICGDGDSQNSPLFRVYDMQGTFYAIYRYDYKNKNFTPEKMFLPNQ